MMDEGKNNISDQSSTPSAGRSPKQPWFWVTLFVPGAYLVHEIAYGISYRHGFEAPPSSGVGRALLLLLVPPIWLLLTLIFSRWWLRGFLGIAVIAIQSALLGVGEGARSRLQFDEKESRAFVERCVDIAANDDPDHLTHHLSRQIAPTTFPFDVPWKKSEFRVYQDENGRILEVTVDLPCSTIFGGYLIYEVQTGRWRQR